MAFEVELKARLSQPAQIEAKVAERGEFLGETRKEDVYFCREGDPQPLPANRFRLRREGNRAVVNFKQALEAEGVEVSREVEFEVDDAHAFFQFAGRFGFEPFVVKQKTTRQYRVGRALVELSRVEHLGHFIEIEILCAAESGVPVARIELARLLNELGLEAADLEPRLYIELIRQVHPVRYRFVDDRRLAWPFEEISPAES